MTSTLLTRMYSAYAAGDFAAVAECCAENATFQVPGKSPLAGKYDRAGWVTGLLLKQRERSGGTLKTEVHDVLASDRHGLVLTTETLVREGKKVEYRSVHVWRLEDGRPVAGYLYPRDLYQFDAIWS
jgi:uncharacterized protein